MKHRKLLVLGLLVIVTAFAAFGLSNASEGNPFNQIDMKLNVIIGLLDEVISQLGCEPTIGVPKTGQTTLYVPGDDGDWEAGIDWPRPRFIDNLDGTVTDNLTGLLWLKDANCAGRQTWVNAIAFSNNLADGSCGLSDDSAPGDWRLANRNELESLMDFGRFAPALPSGHPFENVQGGAGNDYWSSTTYLPRTNEAWYVEMYNGVADAYDKGHYTFLWPVRGGN